MANTNNDRLLYEIDKLEKIVNQLKFDFTLINDEELKNSFEILDKKVRIQRAKIKALEIKENLKQQ